MNPDETTFEKSPNGVMENPGKPQPKNLKEATFLLLRGKGLSIVEAGKAISCKKSAAYALEKKVASYDLTSQFWLEKASKALKSLIEGQPFGGLQAVKDSTVLAAVQMVYDRHQPIVRKNLNLNVETKIDLVDLSKYVNKSKEPMRIYDEGVSST